MGTRNLTMVIQDQQTRIAQYGQWDGFPDGQGITILAFLQDKSNIEKLKQIIPKLHFETEQDIKDKKEFAKSLGSTNGCLDYKQAALYDMQYPLENPNLGAGVLNKLLEYNNLSEIVLVNSEDFARESLFCQWAYVIDLDKNTLEVYKGLNRLEVSKEERFYNLNDPKNNYRPIKLVQSFSIDKLPDAEKFINECYVEQKKMEVSHKDLDNELER
jgi:hypothetical protein